MIKNSVKKSARQMQVERMCQLLHETFFDVWPNYYPDKTCFTASGLDIQYSGNATRYPKVAKGLILNYKHEDVNEDGHGDSHYFFTLQDSNLSARVDLFTPNFRDDDCDGRIYEFDMFPAAELDANVRKYQNKVAKDKMRKIYSILNEDAMRLREVVESFIGSVVVEELKRRNAPKR